MVDFTVAIPTYNGEHRLPKLLDCLHSQASDKPLRWEVIVVDNNSLDDTAGVVRRYQRHWPSHIPLRYCFAPEQGVAFARQRAIEAAQGEWVGFLDDDNLPQHDWVEQAVAFANAHPQIGAFGSQVHGEFETPLPKQISKRLAPYLAIIERGPLPRRYDPQHPILPPTAGLVVRRQIWLEAVPQRLFLNHKGKAAGLASEDLEAMLHIQRRGLEIWYNPSMVVYHQIPRERVERDYLVSLFRCVGLSRFYIRMLRFERWQRPFTFVAFILNDLRKLMLHVLVHGRNSQSDLLVACDRQYLVSTVISPIFLLKKALDDVRHAPLNDSQAAIRKTWIQTLSQAFENEQLCLYQQPIQSITTTAENHADVALRPPTYEVLLRFRSQTQSGTRLIAAHEFLPMAQHYQLMRTVDRWVIRKFLHHYSADQTTVQSPRVGVDANNVLYFVNLSQVSVEDSSFLPFLERELGNQQINPSVLCLELPVESVLSLNCDRLSAFLKRVKHLGCQVSVEHVSRRHTLNRLRGLPFDYLKIHGTLVQSLSADRDAFDRTAHSASETVQRIVQGAQELGICAIASAVETDSILHQVRQLGLSMAQGYAIGRPEPLTPRAADPGCSLPPAISC